MNYINIINVSSVDFEGWSTVLQVSGCSHGCQGCFNQQAWQPSFGKHFTDENYKEIIENLSKPFISNLVLQGGDPLQKSNVKEVIGLCRSVREALPEKRIVVFTGYTYSQLLQDTLRKPLLEYIDVLVDGKYEKGLEPAPFRGSSNQEIINVKESLASGEKLLYSLVQDN